MKKYDLVFDEVIKKQIEEASKNQRVRSVLNNMLDKIERMGPRAGKRLDPKVGLFEVKNKKPPIRLYYKFTKGSKEIYVFEYEMKTGTKSQNKTIRKLRGKSSDI